MDQAKIGEFLKALRKEKGLTQEQLAEQFQVNRRTVSRWETGTNLPDLDVLMEMSDYYEVDLRELLDGERKSEQMNTETKETVLKAADYTNADTEKYNKQMRIMNTITLVVLVVSIIVREATLNIDNSTVKACSDLVQGFSVGMAIACLLVSTRYGVKIQNFKKRLLEKMH